jgi:acetylornithine deacetylase
MATQPPDSLVQTLQQMVRIDSVNGALTGKACAESTAVDWAEWVAGAWGFKSRRLPVADRADQLLITHEVSKDAPWLLFDSHLDTVAVDGMTVDPFGGELHDGRIYGRGACDTKGTGAAMLWALREYALQQNGPNNIALLFSVDEEVGMFGIRSFRGNDYPSLGFQPAGVIVGEPTELHPVIAHNGLIRWKVTTHGVAAHSSVPHQGRSAISAMMRVVDAIESRYIPNLSAENELTGRAACSVNMIRGGSSANIIPDACTIDIDRRVVPAPAPGEDFESIKRALAQIIESVKNDLPTLEHTIEVVVTHPPLMPAGSEQLTDTIKTVLKQQGLPTLCVGAPFATHAGYFCEAGLPTVVLGPGETHKAHTKDEYISTDQLERGAALYLALMHAPFIPHV